jgi:hypothetical protein
VEEPPLTDAIIVAVGRLFDDRDRRREPAHSAIEFQIKRGGLATSIRGGSRRPWGRSVECGRRSAMRWQTSLLRVVCWSGI